MNHLTPFIQTHDLGNLSDTGAQALQLGPATLTITATALTISVGPSRLIMTAEGITLDAPRIDLNPNHNAPPA